MRYFLKKSVPSKRGVYLQIYQSFYVSGKGGRNKSFKAVGYVNDLIAQGIDSPFDYAQNLVDELISYVAPTFLGRSARAMLNADFDRMAEQLRFKLIDVTQMGDDVRLRLIPSQETL